MKEEKQAASLLEDASFSQESLIFFSSSENAASHKKLLVKTLKMLTQSLLDNLPETEAHLTPLIRKVVLLSQSSHRLARYCFSFAGIHILKQILTNTRNVRDSVARYERKYQDSLNTGKQSEAAKARELRDAIQKANGILVDWSETLVRHVLVKRSQDCQAFIRKVVLDLLQQHESVFYPEIFNVDSESCQLVLESVFQGLKDEPSQQKVALANIQAILKVKERMEKP